MQETKYQDGTETKEFFKSMFDALEDAKQKDKKNPIKSLKVTMVIPKNRK